MANSFNEKEQKMTLKGYYYSLREPVSPRRKLILDIMQKCNVVETTAFNWIMGRSKPDNPNHLEILTELTGIAVEDLWTD